MSYLFFVYLFFANIAFVYANLMLTDINTNIFVNFTQLNITNVSNLECQLFVEKIQTNNYVCLNSSEILKKNDKNGKYITMLYKALFNKDELLFNTVSENITSILIDKLSKLNEIFVSMLMDIYNEFKQVYTKHETDIDYIILNYISLFYGFFDYFFDNNNKKSIKISDMYTLYFIPKNNLLEFNDNESLCKNYLEELLNLSCISMNKDYMTYKYLNNIKQKIKI